MLLPKVVGYKLTGELSPQATATDLVLAITKNLRAHGFVACCCCSRSSCCCCCSRCSFCCWWRS